MQRALHDPRGSDMPTIPWKNYSNVVPDKEYLAVLTYLSLKRYRTIPRFHGYTMQIRKQLEEAEGVMGYALKAHIWKRNFWTISVWEDEAHLRQFAFDGLHRSVMSVLRDDLAGFKNTRWSIRGSEVPPSWSDALDRHKQAAA